MLVVVSRRGYTAVVPECAEHNVLVWERVYSVGAPIDVCVLGNGIR